MAPYQLFKTIKRIKARVGRQTERRHLTHVSARSLKAVHCRQLYCYFCAEVYFSFLALYKAAVTMRTASSLNDSASLSHSLFVGCVCFLE
jgi:hypothetical protein